jgi:predicted nucleotidyltransferase component of viral defense system
MGAGQAEHEYAQLCVLDALARVSPLADAFCFKGGTALRLLYFADWRHSVDLDFTALPMFPADDLQPLVENWFAAVYAVHGMEVRLLDFHRVNGAARMRARFVGPLRYPSRLLFDVTLDEPVLQTPQRRLVVASIFANLQPAVLTYSLEEILAEKMRSIIQRGKARDYYDVWRLLAEKPDAFDPAVVNATLAKKCRHKGMEEPHVQHFLAPQRLAQAEPYWERDLTGQVAGAPLPAWPQVTEDLALLLQGFVNQ